MRKVIVNTTPIIALADIGYLNLLKELYGEILIPEAVLSEIISEPAHTLVKQSDWIKVKKAPIQSQKNSFSTRLHAGEIEVITLAQECSADLLILDDNMAKKTAKYLGLTGTGTMGVLLRAKREGHIEKVKPIVDRLIADGLFISSTVKEYVLSQAGEQ